ncbi:plasmid pRiA4b ORF-3 family protein [Nocardioides carbamazepini]|nr:plasmid pRiA4b ORF-3 family protein [Nocardioides carbamazepini]
MAGATPAEGKALLDALMNGQVTSIFEKLERDERPDLLPVPERPRGYRVRLDLHGAKPPIWRRLELPGDLTLPRVHVAIQAAMGWYDSHLHRFRTGNDPRSACFATEFDLDEGDDGMPEADVRLDQILAEKGDELWYEYDFGDGWDHKLVVEAVLDGPPATVRCTAGRMACPPEDCGGIWGYDEIAAWVRSGYDDALLPQSFDDAEHGRDWLPLDWHPDHFDLDEINDALTIASAGALMALLGQRADPMTADDARQAGAPWAGFTSAQAIALEKLAEVGRFDWMARTSSRADRVGQLLESLEAIGVPYARVREAMQSIGYGRRELEGLDRWATLAT